MNCGRKLSLRTLCVALGLSAVLLYLFGCGGAPALQAPDQLDQAVPDTETPPERNTLSTHMPALGALAVGSEFSFSVRGEFVDELFQASGRVLYDPQCVQPLGFERGGFVPRSDVFICNLAAAEAALRSPDARLPRVIPFAFTGLPGERGLNGRGELLRLRFRLLKRPEGGAPLRLLNDPEYLQLRGAQGRRLAFDFATAEVSQ